MGDRISSFSSNQWSVGNVNPQGSLTTQMSWSPELRHGGELAITRHWDASTEKKALRQIQRQIMKVQGPGQAARWAASSLWLTYLLFLVCIVFYFILHCVGLVLFL